MKSRIPIAVLAILSLVCTLLSYTSNFFYYDYDYSTYIPSVSDGAYSGGSIITDGSGGNVTTDDSGRYYVSVTVPNQDSMIVGGGTGNHGNGTVVSATTPSLKFHFPDLVTLLMMLISLAPPVLLCLCLLVFHEQRTGTVLYILLCGVIMVSSLFGAVSVVSALIRGDRFLDLNALVFGVALSVLFALLAMNAAKGTNKTVYPILVSSVGVMYAILNAWTQIRMGWVVFQLEFYSLAAWSGTIGMVALYVALLLFGLNNALPALTSASAE